MYNKTYSIKFVYGSTSQTIALAAPKGQMIEELTKPPGQMIEEITNYRDCLPPTVQSESNVCSYYISIQHTCTSVGW